jgi:hypothetical protein
MNMILKIMMPALLSTVAAFGESTSSLAQFIVQEIKSCESAQFEIKEITFSDGDAKFRIAPSMTGSSLEFSLVDVDVYTIRTLRKTGKDEYAFAYSLVVTTRGRTEGIRKNMSRVAGTEIILGNILNGQKIKNLERAFTRLTERVTGREQRRSVPWDQP